MLKCRIVKGGLTKSQIEYMLNQNENSALWSMTKSGQSQEAFSNCTIVDIPVDYRKQGLAFAYPKDSPLLEAFNHVLKQMAERGALKKIKENYAVRPQVRVLVLTSYPIKINVCVSVRPFPLRRN